MGRTRPQRLRQGGHARGFHNDVRATTPGGLLHRLIPIRVCSIIHGDICSQPLGQGEFLVAGRGDGDCCTVDLGDLESQHRYATGSQR